jgi:hypothetical protein
MYDPEAIIQDADIEMMELEEAARRAKELRDAGHCDHGWSGPKEDGNPDGEFVCYYCGHTWASWEARDLELYGESHRF